MESGLGYERRYMQTRPTARVQHCKPAVATNRDLPRRVLADDREMDMNVFDPYGELHLQQKRAAHRRELEYAALYCAALLAILALVLVMGGKQ